MSQGERSDGFAEYFVVAARFLGLGEAANDSGQCALEGNEVVRDGKTEKKGSEMVAPSEMAAASCNEKEGWGCGCHSLGILLREGCRP